MRRDETRCKELAPYPRRVCHAAHVTQDERHGPRRGHGRVPVRRRPVEEAQDFVDGRGEHRGCVDGAEELGCAGMVEIVDLETQSRLREGFSLLRLWRARCWPWIAIDSGRGWDGRCGAVACTRDWGGGEGGRGLVRLVGLFAESHGVKFMESDLLRTKRTEVCTSSLVGNEIDPRIADLNARNANGQDGHDERELHVAVGLRIKTTNPENLPDTGIPAQRPDSWAPATLTKLTGRQDLVGNPSSLVS